MGLRRLAQTCILAVWSRSIGVHFYVGAQSSHAYTDFGDNGWCFGSDNHFAGTTSSAEECWTKCFGIRYGWGLVAIDWWGEGDKTPWTPNTNNDNECYCQNSCNCRAGVGRNATLLMATSVASDTAALPEVCTNQPKVMSSEAGKCVGGSNISVGVFNSALDCWNGCWDILGEQTWASDWWSPSLGDEYNGECFCQDSCDCREDIGSLAALMTQSAVATSVDDLPDACSEEEEEESFSFAWLMYALFGIVITVRCYLVLKEKKDKMDEEARVRREYVTQHAMIHRDNRPSTYTSSSPSSPSSSSETGVVSVVEAAVVQEISSEDVVMDAVVVVDPSSSSSDVRLEANFSPLLNPEHGNVMGLFQDEGKT